MAQPYAVRAVEQTYEVYRIADAAAMCAYAYATESGRARALGMANATRDDMNRDAGRTRPDRIAPHEETHETKADDLGESPDF